MRFPENAAPGPAAANIGLPPSGNELPPPDVVADVVVPRPPGSEPAYRVLFADDSAIFLTGLETSAAAHLSGIAEVRTWLARTDSAPLHLYVAQEQANTGWRPDLLVLDINMGAGGYNGLDYLRLLRDPQQSPGWAALPIVLATSNAKRDVDSGQLSRIRTGGSGAEHPGQNLTGVNPSQWHAESIPAEPEAILYGKQGDLSFIVRVLEQLPLWRLAARRRAWNRLLANVAERLDRPKPDPQVIGEWVAAYLHGELAVSDVFVRWRDVGRLFKLIGCRTEPTYEPLGSLLDPATIPLLTPLVDGSAKLSTNNDGVSRREAGILADRLAGKRMLAASAVLDGRVIGYMTVFRPVAAPAFDPSVDGEPLSLLARLLASALGRAEALKHEEDRDNQHLEFARELAKRQSEAEIALALARLVHATVNKGHEEAEVTVRLVDYSTGEIQRVAHTGIATPDLTIHLWDDNSMVQRVVKSMKIERIDDAMVPSVNGHGQRVSQSARGPLRSELCVPLESGSGAIGAVNAEHLQVGVYSEDDERFVATSAALAAAAIQQLRGQRFLLQMANFASDYSKLAAPDLRRTLMGLLIAYSGASAVVRLIAPETAEPDQPWSISDHDDIEVRILDGDQEQLRTYLDSIYRHQWNETTIREWIVQQRWNDSDCEFQAHSNVAVRLRGYATKTKNDPKGIEDAIAALWLRDAPSSRPYACLLLLWFFKPGLSPDDAALLGRFARLLSALETRSRETDTWMRQSIVGEQAQALGMVFQHFRHRLKGDLGALRGLTQRMHAALNAQPPRPVDGLLRSLDEQITVLSGRFHKSTAYIKVPELQQFDLRAAHQQALSALEVDASRVQIDDNTPVGLSAWGDADIYELAIFSLLDNAVEAVTGVPRARIEIQARGHGGRVETEVADNGPGVDPAIAGRLFQFGVSSKAHGLGSALAFAQLRLRLAGGWISLVPPVDYSGEGARFVVRLPANKASASPNRLASS